MPSLSSVIILASFWHLVSSQTSNEGLRNMHLKIEGEEWWPFLTYDFDENGTAINYRGIMWDLLLFMQKARNFTFSMVSEADYTWGKCPEVNNCTGMIGMVNRGEVDIAIGKYKKEKTVCTWLRERFFLPLTS